MNRFVIDDMKEILSKLSTRYNQAEIEFILTPIINRLEEGVDRYNNRSVGPISGKYTNEAHTYWQSVPSFIEILNKLISFDSFTIEEEILIN